MTWIVMGHTTDYFHFVLLTWTNYFDIDQPYKFIKEPIYFYTVSVDTFFAMGGILLAYITLQELDALKARSPNGIITGMEWFKFWGMFYVHRYIRY